MEFVNTLKKTIKKSALYKKYLFLEQIFGELLRKKHPLQRTNLNPGFKLVRLGSAYGGWTVVNDKSLYGSTIISAGLGEDASFDVEFVSFFKAKVVVVDPTPRAIKHFDSLRNNIGERSKKPYSEGGIQEVVSYDLSTHEIDSLVLCKKALWVDTTAVKFYQPPNPSHVSHSIVDLHSSGLEKSSFITVPATDILTLLADYNLDAETLALVKLDIEGAEIDVIYSMFENRVFPKQILIEFDEMHSLDRASYHRISAVNEALRSHGYECIFTDGLANFLYFRTHSV